MTVKNQVRTVRGLLVKSNLLVGAEKFEFDGDNQSVFDTLNSFIGANHGTVIADSQSGVLLWVDEDAVLSRKEVNLKLTMMTGQPVYGDAVMIGYESTEDGGSRFVSLQADLYTNLVGN